MKVGLFAYNFPHRKTQDFLIRLIASGYEVVIVLAADPVPLGIPSGTMRTKLRHVGLIHPCDIAKALGLRYEVVEHNGPEAVALLQESRAEVGIIAGGRILKGPILKTPPLGIVNFHPGKIPQARGLDALLWSIYGDIDLGVTAHIIDHRVDAGRLVRWQPLTLYKDDTWIDLGERLIELQTDMLPDVLQGIARGEVHEVAVSEYPLNRKMPPDLEAEVVRRLPQYLARRTSSPD